MRNIALNNKTMLESEYLFLDATVNADLYKSLQCHGSTGYCWCVDIVTGEDSNRLEPFRLWEMSSVDVDLETLCD